MTDRRRFLPLRLKFLAAFFLSLLAALAGVMLVYLAGESYIQLYYMDEARMQERTRGLLYDFVDFVQERRLDVHNARDITRWAKEQDYVYLLIYQDGRVIIDSGWWDEQEYYTDFTELEDVPAAARSAGTEEGGVSFGYGMVTATVAFSDGEYEVVLYDFSDEPLYDRVRLLSFGAGILIFVLLLLVYHSKTIRRIIRLSQEVEVIAGGSLEEPIARQPADELGALAQHVDTMRFSIINEMRAEQEAWNANSDLITRMSHDIRTPLTVLLGFLELLEEGNYSGDETYRHYLGICKKNAFQLKELADRLFQYFLVFGHREHGLELEVADARVLLGQLIGEHAVWLTEQGWQVETVPLESTVFVEVDTVYTKRLCDNVFSNIEKYADPNHPVEIRLWVAGDELHITVRNRIRSTSRQVESTNIGLKTCERISELMGGRFLVHRTETEFCAEVIQPVYREPEEVPAAS